MPPLLFFFSALKSNNAAPTNKRGILGKKFRLYHLQQVEGTLKYFETKNSAGKPAGTIELMTCTTVALVEDHLVLHLPTGKVLLRPASYSEVNPWKSAIAKWVSYLRQVPVFRVEMGRSASVDLFHSWGYKKAHGTGEDFDRFYLWFQDGLLQYFVNEEEDEALGYLEMSSVTSVSEVSKERAYHVLKIHIKAGGSWTLGFDSRKLADEWRARLAPPDEKGRGSGASIFRALRTVLTHSGSGDDLGSPSRRDSGPSVNQQQQQHHYQAQAPPPEEDGSVSISMELPEQGLIQGEPVYAAKPVEVLVDARGIVSSAVPSHDRDDYSDSYDTFAGTGAKGLDDLSPCSSPRGRAPSVTLHLRKIARQFNAPDEVPSVATASLPDADKDNEEVQRLSDKLGEIIKWRVAQMASGDEESFSQSDEMDRLREQLEQHSWHLDSINDDVAKGAIAKAIWKHSQDIEAADLPVPKADPAARTQAVAKILQEGLKKLDQAAPGNAPAIPPKPKVGVAGTLRKSGVKDVRKVTALAIPAKPATEAGAVDPISPHVAPAVPPKPESPRRPPNLLIVAPAAPPESRANRNPQSPRSRSPARLLREEPPTNSELDDPEEREFLNNLPPPTLSNSRGNLAAPTSPALGGSRGRVQLPASSSPSSRGATGRGAGGGAKPSVTAKAYTAERSPELRASVDDSDYPNEVRRYLDNVEK